ncbi:MAG: hypothetical protein R3Y09_04055 [Clostridia bacterium]
MKRFIALILAIAIACPLVACSSSSSSSTSSSSSSATGIITVTLPASFYSNKTEAEIKQEASDLNCISYSINDDGSVNFSLTDTAYETVLSDIIAEIETIMEEMIDPDSGVEGFGYIDYTEDFSQFNIYLDPTYYTEYMVMYAYTFMVSGAYYQTFAGVPQEDIDVVVRLIDFTTDETLKVGSYKDIIGA